MTFKSMIEAIFHFQKSDGAKRSSDTALPINKKPRTIVSLSDRELLVETSTGGWLVVPSFNVDVAIGPVRDGCIEPWTTRLVQECLKLGDCYFNAGGNYGYYASLAAHIVGSQGLVITVEPNPHILPYLMKTIFWSGIGDRTEVYNTALWYETGNDVEFNFDPQYLGGGSIRSMWGVTFTDAINVNSLDEAIWNHMNVKNVFDSSGQWQKAKGHFVSFRAKTQTIDAIVGDRRVDLLHLDIEGAEPFALQGAKDVIKRNSNIRLITEWSAHTHKYGGDDLKSAVLDVFEFLTSLGFKARYLEPRVAADGGLYLSDSLDFDHLTQSAIHGDYFWTRD